MILKWVPTAIFFYLSHTSASATVDIEVVTENFRPYNYLEDGEVKGESTAIVRKVLKHAGVSFNLNVYPWTRAYEMALKQPNVLIYSMARMPSREMQFKWIGPVGKGVHSMLYRLKDEPFKAPKSISESKKFQILCSRNSMTHKWLTENHYPNVIVATNVPSMIKMFLRGRGDLMAISSTSVKQEFKHLDKPFQLLSSTLELFDTQSYMAMSLESDDRLVQSIRRSYQMLASNGQIDLDSK